MNCKKLFALTMLVALLITISPVYAWTYPDGTTDTTYEKFGPRLDKIYIGLYPTQEAEWEDLKLGKIDMTDWPLSKTYLDELSARTDMNIQFYGPELGFDAVDINNDNGPTKAPGYANPVYKKNPAGFVQEGTEPYENSSAEFRKALWRTMDRASIIAEVWLGLGYPMYSICTQAQGPYLHPNATVPVESGGLMWGFDLDKAKAILNAAGFVDTDANGWRNFPVTLGGDGNDISLIYYGRSDDTLRNNLAVAHAAWIQEIGVKVDLRLRDRSVTYPEVMVNKNFMLYTAGWSIGRDADSAAGLYYSGYYWHPGFCYNYDRVNCTEYDTDFEHLEEANTNEEVTEWAWKLQEAFNLKAFGMIPVVSNAGYKAYYKTYTGGNKGVPVSPDDGENAYRGQLWKGIVNLGSYGVDNYWTFLNAYAEGNLMGGTMRYGFKTQLLEKPSNPAYAEWLWDWNILGLTYESLLYRDAYTYQWMPWLCKKFTVITWVDPEDGLTKSGVRFTLRSDITWSDGTPFTAADVEYSLVELDDELINLGYGAPWWYSNTIYIKSCYIIDPCNIEVLLDIKSFFAVGWIGGCTILPKHIWKALVDKEKATPGSVNFWGASVDPDVIGTGPFRFKEYNTLAPAHVMLVANAPGSSVKTSWPGSKTVVSTKGFFNYYPIEIDVGTLDDRQVVEPYSDVVINVTLHNRWIDPIPNTASGTPHGDLIVTKTIQVYWMDTLMHEEVHAGIDLPACYDETELITINDVNPCHWKVVVTVLVTGPDTVLVSKDAGTEMVANPWKNKIITYTYYFWSTIPTDIGGTTYYDVIGMPGYPYKDELPAPDCITDIGDILTAALAYGSYPGHPRWSSQADVVEPYYFVDISDLLEIALHFGQPA